MISPQESENGGNVVMKVLGAIAFFLVSCGTYILHKQGKAPRPKDLSVRDFLTLKKEVKQELHDELQESLENSQAVEFRRMRDTLEQINSNLSGEINTIKRDMRQINEIADEQMAILRKLRVHLSESGGD